MLISLFLFVAVGSQPQVPESRPTAASAVDLFRRVDTNGLRVSAVTVEPGVASVGLALAVGCGTDHDPPGQTGMAQVVAEALRLHFEQQFGDSGAPGSATTLSVRVTRSATTVSATVGSDAWQGVVAAMRRVVDGTLEFDGDTARRAVARARLRADDESAVLPGTILMTRAARRIAAGTAAGRQRVGIPDEIGALDSGALEVRLHAHYRPAVSVLAAVGAVGPDDLLAAVRGWPLREGDAAEPLVHDSGPAFEDAGAHPLVDAPYVTAALRAKRWGDEDFVPFLIAVGVLRARAVRTFGSYRGGELRARFEFVHHDPLEPSAVVTVNRRGRDGDTVERVRKEVDGIFADLRSHGAAAQEIAYAAAELAQRLSLPASGRDFAALVTRQPRLLQLRAIVLTDYATLGWPADLSELLRKTPVTHVARVLQAMVAPDAITWLSLR